MRKATTKNKIIIIAVLLILNFFGCFWIFKAKGQVEKHSVYLDLSIPLYQDDDVTENFQKAKSLQQAINKKIAHEDNLKVIISDVESETMVQKKNLNADLTLSIQCFKAEKSKITSYLPISNDIKHDDSLRFANIVAKELGDMNYQGNFYYYLLPEGSDMYHELISQEKIDDEMAVGLPLLDRCQKPIIMLNYYYQENDEEVMNEVASRVAMSIKTYFNEA